MASPCERFARVPRRERIASPSREARASCSEGVAKPIAPTQRLPALHLRPGARGEGLFKEYNPMLTESQAFRLAGR